MRNLDYRLTQTVAPAVEPVSVADAKQHARIDIHEDDGYVAGLIAAARRLVERQQRRQLITATWQLQLDRFPGYIGQTTGWGGYAAELFLWGPHCHHRQDGFDPWPSLELPIAPVQSVTSIAYVDFDGTNRTLDPTRYVVETPSNQVSQIIPTYGNTWPSTRWQPNAVTVTFVAGYGDPDNVPETTRQAIYLLIGHWYENREATGTNMTEIPLGVQALLDAERWSIYP